MNNVNTVIVTGNLCRDPEIRFTKSGLPVASLAIGVNRSWKDADGEKKEEVTFIDCTAFSKTAEVIGEHFSKGDPILIQGRLKQERWENEKDEKRSRIVIVVDSFSFIGGKKTDKASKPKYSETDDEHDVDAEASKAASAKIAANRSKKKTK